MPSMVSHASAFFPFPCVVLLNERSLFYRSDLIIKKE
jgi:hypothetical protein